MITRLRQWLNDSDNPEGMWRIGPAIGIALGIALATAAGLIATGYVLLDPTGELTISDFVDIVVIILGVIAGGGGSVALVVAYRRQRVNERSDSRDTTRLMNDRFQAASAQLGHSSVAVRLAGAYAMANLADDWNDQSKRQTCIEVLCSYLRHAGKEPSSDDGPDSREAWTSDREVRHTILRIIADRLRPPSRWSGHSFDLTGVTVDLDQLDLRFAQFPAGVLSFRKARFVNSTVYLAGSLFGGGVVIFNDAEIIEGFLSFQHARFYGGQVNFIGTQFRRCNVMFDEASFGSPSNSPVTYESPVDTLQQQMISFNDAPCGIVNFHQARFAGSHVTFHKTQFKSGLVSFAYGHLREGGLDFAEATFDGCTVDFSRAGSWPGREALGLPVSAPTLALPDSPDTPFDPIEDQECSDKETAS